MESHRKGDLTEATVLAELKRREVPVSFPFGDNERYDAVVEAPGGQLYRLQIKTGWLSDGVIDFHGRSSHTNSQGNVYKPYDGDVDYFTIYCHELENLYLIPEERVGSSMALRVDPPKRPDPKINPAESYEFDRRWPPEESHSDEPGYETWTVSKDRSVARVVEKLETIGATTYRKTHGTGVCDAVVETENGAVRLTVRTVSESEGRLQMSRGADETARRDTEDTDYYALYWPARERTYLVNTDEFGTSLSLRTGTPEQVQHDTRFAEDYRIETVWPPDGTPRLAAKSSVGSVVAAFDELGVPVGVVHDESVTYDLLAAREGAFVRVAVVPVWCSRGCLRLKPDSKASVDVFVLYHREGDTCYAVDADRFDRSISLRVDPPAKPDPRINDATAFELERNWA